MNEQLNYEFIAWEVQVALKQMTLLKASGPNGMPLLFYQNYWNLVGMDVTQFVLSFLNSACLPQHLNHTFITLIQKVNKPELVSEFRSISLCNVLYKTFSKVLANRLKRILPKIITTEHQSAFTKNRVISDNIMVAFETLHSMQHHISVKDGFMVLKLDMSKVYDKVKWSFLKSVIRKKWFNKYWIFFFNALCQNSLFILVNGEPKGFINSNKGYQTK